MLSKPLSSKVRKLPPLNDQECFFCGNTYGLAIHEIWYGRNRQISIAYGMMAHLCFTCHRALHDGQLDDTELKVYGKSRFKEMYPNLDWDVIFR